MEALEFPKENRFPNIDVLKILATLLVSNASAEQSFSTPKRQDICLHNTISKERLNGLTLVVVHARRDIDSNMILDRFGIFVSCSKGEQGIARTVLF